VPLFWYAPFFRSWLFYWTDCQKRGATYLTPMKQVAGVGTRLDPWGHFGCKTTRLFSCYGFCSVYYWCRTGLPLASKEGNVQSECSNGCTLATAPIKDTIDPRFSPKWKRSLATEVTRQWTGGMDRHLESLSVHLEYVCTKTDYKTLMGSIPNWFTSNSPLCGLLVKICIWIDITYWRFLHPIQNNS
jgi:hypothetical protein